MRRLFHLQTIRRRESLEVTLRAARFLFFLSFCLSLSFPQQKGLDRDSKPGDVLFFINKK